MGTYFSVRAEKKLPLFESVTDRTTAPKATLRLGKLAARSFADLFEGAPREAAARTFTQAIIESYWNKIQKNAPHVFPFARPVCRSESDRVA